MLGKGWVNNSPRRKCLCVILGLGIALPIALSAQELYRLKNDNLRQRTILNTNHIAARIEAQLAVRFRLLSHLARDLSDGGIIGEADFQRRAQELVNTFPDYQAINWADSENKVQWVVPLADNAAVVETQLDTFPAAAATLHIAREQGQPKATPLLELIQGGRGFMTYFPINGGPYEGVVTGAFRIQPLLASLVPRELGKEVQITLADDHDTSLPHPSPTQVERAIGVLGQGFTLIVAPRSFSSGSIHFAALGLLLFGVTIAFVAGSLAYKLLESRAHLFNEELHQGALFDAVPDHMLLLSPDLSTVAYHRSPYDNYEFPCKHPAEQWMPAILQSELEHAMLEGNIRKTEVEIDGRTYEVRIVPDPNRHTIMSLRDVTERMELTAQRVLLARLVASSSHLAAVLGPGGQVEYLNPAGRQLLVLDSTPDRLDDILELSSDILSPLENAKSWAGRLQLLDRNGDEIPVHLTSFAISTGLGPRLGLIAVDLRRTVELEQQLEQAHKMEALGTLAAGVAHDFNNAVTVFQTGVELLETIETMPEDAREDLGLLRSAAASAANVAGQLLAFARPKRSATQPFILDKILSASAQMIARSVRENIEIQWSLNAKDVRLVGDPGALQQALLNLVINARDAIPVTGHITICTQVQNFHQQPFIVLTVEDNGSGVPEDLQKKIFEPFFTTKARGQGSGLGLAMVRRVVDSFEGQISMQSQLGKGTKIIIQLPAHSSSVEETTESIDLHHQRTNSARVILVEDDPPVRTLIQRGLLQAGHKVEVATDGLEALKLLSKPTDVLITDLIMPRMGGAELARRARREHPDVHILLITGHPELPPEQVLPMDVEIIPKPLSLNHLLKKLDLHINSLAQERLPNRLASSSSRRPLYPQNRSGTYSALKDS